MRSNYSQLVLLLCFALLLVLPDIVKAQARGRRQGGRRPQQGGGRGGNKPPTKPTPPKPAPTNGGNNNGGNNNGGNNNGGNNNGGNNNGGNNGQNAFCAGTGLTASDGTQLRDGACSSTPMGSIPSVNKMVSSLITKPENGAAVNRNQELQVVVDYRNLDTGFFSDPTNQYYTIPQTLSGDGTIQGHSHITVQNLNNAKAAPDARTFAFFKGLNDEAAGGRTLSVTIPAGTLKQDGTYRICSMSGSNSHQPVVMPVAQRGAQDDCIRIKVSSNGGNGGGRNGRSGA